MAFAFMRIRNRRNAKRKITIISCFFATLLDLRGQIPSFIRITDGLVHDVNILDEIIPEPGAFYVMDRAYLDFSRLHTLLIDNDLHTRKKS